MSDWPRANLEVAANIFKPSFKPRVLAATHTLKMRHRRNVKCGGDRWLRTIVSVDPRLVNFEDQNCNQTIVLHRLYHIKSKLHHLKSTRGITFLIQRKFVLVWSRLQYGSIWSPGVLDVTQLPGLPGPKMLAFRRSLKQWEQDLPQRHHQPRSYEVLNSTHIAPTYKRREAAERFRMQNPSQLRL